MPQFDGEPSDNLYITGLPDEFDGGAVTQFFSVCGKVTQARALGNGCALVRFATIEEATSVKDNMTGQQPVGCPKPITITFSTTTKHNDWTCPRCADLQFAKNSVCRKCSCPRPTGDAEVDAAALAAMGSWDGDAGSSCKGKGGKAGNEKGGKGKGKTPPTPAWLMASATESKNGEWYCPGCGDLQFARNPECRMCGCPKDGWGGSYGKAGGKGGWSDSGKGGWSDGGQGGWSDGGCQASPYGKADKGDKGKGAGKGKMDIGFSSTIRGVIDCLIKEGLPGGDYIKDKNALYVTNLPPDCTEHHLYQIFSTFGAIPPRGVKVMPNNPGARGYGFVNFLDPENAEFALMALNGVTQPDGVRLTVKHKTKRGEAPPRDPAASPPWLLGAGSVAPSPTAGIDPTMLQRLKTKLGGATMTSYDLSQWYIIEHLAHVTEEEEMKTICDMLLDACKVLGCA